jgi:hypothetical protein
MSLTVGFARIRRNDLSYKITESFIYKFIQEIAMSHATILNCPCCGKLIKIRTGVSAEEVKHG